MRRFLHLALLAARRAHHCVCALVTEGGRIRPAVGCLAHPAAHREHCVVSYAKRGVAGGWKKSPWMRKKVFLFFRKNDCMAHPVPI
ncbi:hypothetical protein [Bradyrhizobium sp. SZCCHNPS1003]|uniref:hypothetical protein n=1 Tax=Bradyrhizobium sp. SZCCHNPS1003 TaxID=3057330 RepID=UPI0028ED892C|nr:hypothetical protein [Bradyrhizobium sp. SZCCHNPS1003]